MRVFGILLLPRIYVRFGAVVGLLVIDSVGIDLQLETVCDCQGTCLLADERCFALFFVRIRTGDRSVDTRARCSECPSSTLVATPRAIVPSHFLQ